MQNKRFKVLDSFRGLAAVFVVLFHMHYLNTVTELKFFRNSYLFVEFFFILSGFVLTHSYYLKQIKFKVFFISRTFRILPLHIFMLFIFILLEGGKYIAYKYGLSFNQEPFTQLSSPSEILPNLLLIQSWIPIFQSNSWNYPSWSISIEYYLYLIFFILMLIKKRSIYILTIIVLSLLIFYFNLSSDILRGFICFFSGSISYLVFLKIYTFLNKINKMNISFIESIILLSLILVIQINFEYKLLIINLLFCLTILIFGLEKGFVSDYLKKDIFLYLGKLSYSIYLTHAALLFCFISFYMIIGKLFNNNLTPMINNIRFIDLGNIYLNYFAMSTTILVTIIISNYTYKYIELKWQSIGKRFY